ncbi:hypothetical protein V7138_14820 [Bacillus sp. JJ1533]|uniref:hypothetical protein n=1 Tax=Bacillus sp. JJ1533 TaxID=3122959 RepID=UPI00300051CB
MDRLRYLIIGLLLLLFVSFPYVRVLLEESMVGTMLIQYPLLVGGGYFLAKGFPRKWRSFFLYFNENGIAGMLITICVIGYWALPRSIDAALNEPFMELAKYISLPFLAGVLLYYSWQLLGSISRAFVWANLISMIFVMSWLYSASPARLCNNYLVTAQQQLGKAMFVLGLVLCILFMLRVFIGKPVVQYTKKEKRRFIRIKTKNTSSYNI